MAEDWTQWGGPARNFQVRGETKPPIWPQGGPRQLWSRDLGDGYAAVVTAGDSAYTMYRKGAQDVVIAMDAATGKTLWETALDAPHRPNMNIEAGPGPHSTPAIAGDRIFVTTVVGTLAALDRKSGKRLWARELWTEVKGTFLERGYASSPLIHKETVVVPVGGKGRAVMAFKQSDGATVWSGGDADNAYSSPIAIRAGTEAIVSFMAKEVIAVDASNGKQLWSVPHRTSFDINAATPVWCEDSGILVVSSAYDGGARGLKLNAGQPPAELWNHKPLRVHHNNLLCIGGVVYGSSGDFGPAPLTAVDAKSGKVLWQDRAFSKASCVATGNTVYVTDDDGTVGLATISPEGMKVLGESQLLRANSWTCPTPQGSRLFVRDRHKLIALDFSAAAK